MASLSSVSSRPTSRAGRVVCSAQGKQQAAPKPSPALLKAVGAVAAAQLLFSGAAFADANPLKDLLPPSATSGAARAERNRETSAAPSFQAVGDALQGQFRTPNDTPQEIGQALDRKTPDIDLTKRPNELIKDAKRSVKNSLPNLSVADPSPQSVLKNTANPLDKSGIIPVQDNLKDLGERAAKTKNTPLEQAGEKAGELGAGQIGDVAKDAANEAGKRLNQVVPGLSLELPNPFSSEAEKDIKKAAAPIKDADSKISQLGEKLDPTTGYSSDVGNAVQAKSEQAKKSTQQVRKQVLGDVSEASAFEKLNIPNPFDSSSGAKGAPSAGPSVTEASKGLGRALNVDDVERSLPEFPSPVELAKADRGEAQAAAERFGGETGGNLPKPNLPSLPNLPKPDLSLPSAGGVVDKVKGAAEQAQNSLPNLSLGLDPKAALDKAQDAAKDAAKDLPDLPSTGEVKAKLPSAGDLKGKLPEVGKGAPGSKTTAADLGIPKNS